MALYPEYDVLRHYHQTTGFPVEQLVSVLQRLNKNIADPHYEVGISFFMRQDLAAHLKDIWTMEIEPYLEEYFFDQRDKVADFRWPKIGQLLKQTRDGESQQD
jgi:5-methylcytosine-specific restriction protein B